MRREGEEKRRERNLFQREAMYGLLQVLDNAVRARAPYLPPPQGLWLNVDVPERCEVGTEEKRDRDKEVDTSLVVCALFNCLSKRRIFCSRNLICRVR